MASITLRHFLGMISKGDKKDVGEHACVRQKNMICSQGLFKTREGYKKIDSTEYTARINLIYNFHRNVGSNKTIICAGGNLYAS